MVNQRLVTQSPTAAFGCGYGGQVRFVGPVARKDVGMTLPASVIPELMPSISPPLFPATREFVRKLSTEPSSAVVAKENPAAAFLKMLSSEKVTSTSPSFPKGTTWEANTPKLQLSVIVNSARCDSLVNRMKTPLSPFF